MSNDLDLQHRYGRPRPWRRRASIAGLSVLGAGCVGWVVWAGLFYATPEVSGGLFSFDAVDSHTVNVVVDVEVDGIDPAEATCLLRAQSEDKAVVGELSFTPLEGRQEVTVRTERLATSVEMVGCITEGQKRYK